jgi:hypothetical protein
VGAEDPWASRCNCLVPERNFYCDCNGARVEYTYDCCLLIIDAEKRLLERLHLLIFVSCVYLKNRSMSGEIPRTKKVGHENKIKIRAVLLNRRGCVAVFLNRRRVFPGVFSSV